MDTLDQSWQRKTKAVVQRVWSKSDNNESYFRIRDVR